MKIKFRVWDKRNNRMIKPKKFATVIPVIRAYLSKNIINHKRQEQGY